MSEDDDKKTVKLYDCRKLHNADILQRLNTSDPLMGKSAETWYPPRPTLKKDYAAMAKLYDREHDWDDAGTCKKCSVAKLLWETTGMLCSPKK